ncbi:hypothetical protein AVI51_10090 [Piscirickettsia salmonis]|uniref:hypothetical protein n=1 Tax=Piscirickettsia salmonis TaxID=1238 RepID=UPI0006BD6C35|nr:hypothetical protein [Piscirickettsia salmonis]ALA23586.1 membrane protein [Piscirickettsia salmonis]APS54380.1 hypothetical protein AVI51_10090 [Piscirickettsia salmonis]QGO81974.1 hypothetical protein Psal107_03017 [Piscirickettsia salmonis]QGP23849.1 hypothetical protein Psal158_03015 [Piscirickettsia salmonis]QGP27229.1 hypothetical protein Psal159_03014 [Piscirickettsia salmonis]
MMKLFFQSKLLIFLLLIVSVLMQSHIILNEDMLWLVTATQRLLAGGSYVNNFFETNPPLILYLYTPAVLLVKYIHVTIGVAIYSLTFFIGIVSLLLSYLILEKFINDKLTVNLLMISLLIIYFILPMYSFAEREHLMIMLVMPYILLSAAHDQVCVKKLVRAFIGISAALGFCIKPYFVFTPLFIEILFLIKYRNIKILFRYELVFLVATSIIYVIAVYFITPSYLSVIIPYDINFYTGFESVSKLSLFSSPFIAVSIVIFINTIFTCFLFKKYSHFILILLLSIAGLFLAYFIPGQPWYYHLLPMYSVAVFSAVLCFLLLAKNMNNVFSLKKHMLFLFNFFVSVFILFFLVSIIGENVLAGLEESRAITSSDGVMLKSIEHSDAAYYNTLIKYVKKSQSIKSIYFFSSHLETSTLSYYSNVKNASRFPSFWMLPKMFVLRKNQQRLSVTDNKRLNKAITFIQQAVVEDFNQNKPDLVILRQENSIVFLSFFLENSRFKKIWHHYHYAQNIGIYNLYLRDQDKLYSNRASDV